MQGQEANRCAKCKQTNTMASCQPPPPPGVGIPLYPAAYFSSGGYYVYAGGHSGHETKHHTSPRVLLPQCVCAVQILGV